MEKKNVQSTQKCNINLVEANAQWLYSICVKYTFSDYQKAVAKTKQIIAESSYCYTRKLSEFGYILGLSYP